MGFIESEGACFGGILTLRSPGKLELVSDGPFVPA